MGCFISTEDKCKREEDRKEIKRIKEIVEIVKEIKSNRNQTRNYSGITYT